MTSQKISSFTSQSSLDNADLFTFVRSSTNFNVKFSDLKADLGVTGSIVQAGDPLGAPVLNSPAANQYEIRNLESGAGILASVSAQDGVIIKTDFVQGSEIDFVDELIGAQFKIKNPNATASCGCGTSFSI